MCDLTGKKGSKNKQSSKLNVRATEIMASAPLKTVFLSLFQRENQKRKKRENLCFTFLLLQIIHNAPEMLRGRKSTDADYYYFKAQVTATQNPQNPTDPGTHLPENYIPPINHRPPPWMQNR